MEIVKTIKLTPKERKDAIKNLTAVRKLFRNGNGWITGSENETDDNGKESYCLIGAIQEANGPGEDIAALACAVMTGEDFEEATDNVETTITHFNDTTSGGYKDVSRTITKAIKFLKKPSKVSFE